MILSQSTLSCTDRLSPAEPAISKHSGSRGIDRTFSHPFPLSRPRGGETATFGQVHILRFWRRDGKTGISSCFPSFFRVFLAGKEGEILFSGTFPPFSGLCSPQKGGENSQLRGFHILRVFGRDGKEGFSRCFPSLLPESQSAVQLITAYGCDRFLFCKCEFFISESF